MPVAFDIWAASARVSNIASTTMRIESERWVDIADRQLLLCLAEPFRTASIALMPASSLIAAGSRELPPFS